jgi:hypothetical protein
MLWQSQAPRPGFKVQLCHLHCLSIAVRATGPSSVKLNYHRPILTSHCLPASLWKFCELLCFECCIIPLCSLRPKNIVIRNHSMRFVERSSWHNDGSPTCSDERNSTTTFDAECARESIDSLVPSQSTVDCVGVVKCPSKSYSRDIT